MGLAITVEKLDAVPEAQRPLYVEKDGKFHLDLDGYEDPSGLKKALKAERDLRAKHETTVKSWEQLGRTPEEIQEMLAAKEKDVEEAAKKAGNVDAILAGHKSKWEKEKADLVSQLTGDRDGALSLARKAIVDTRIGEALGKLKATPAGVDLLRDRLGKRVKLEFGKDGRESITILDSAGEQMVGSGKDGLATFEDLAKETLRAYPELFEGTGNGGGGANNSRQMGAKSITRKDFEALGPVDRAAKVKEKFVIVD